MMLNSSINKALLAALLPILAPACRAAQAPAGGAPGYRAPRPSVTRARWLMGTVLEAEAYGPRAREAVQAAFAEVERLDRVMSLYKEDSELSALNLEAARRAVHCSADLWEVLTRSAGVHARSGGAFDPTAGSASPGFARVRLDPGTRSVRFDGPGVRLDLGAVGKGYALDAAAAAMRRLGTRAALLNFGGQILALGAPPGQDFWEVRLAGSPLALRMRDRSISTSSQAERPGHVLDPRTGSPVRREGSVAVIAPDATGADAWSTALFVAGLDRLPPGFAGCAIEMLPGRPPVFAGDCKPYLPDPMPAPRIGAIARRTHHEDSQNPSRLPRARGRGLDDGAAGPGPAGGANRAGPR